MSTSEKERIVKPALDDLRTVSVLCILQVQPCWHGKAWKGQLLHRRGTCLMPFLNILDNTQGSEPFRAARPHLACIWHVQTARVFIGGSALDKLMSKFVQ